MIWDGLRLAVSLLSVLPLQARRVTRQTAAVAMALAPAVGLVLGAAGAVVLSAADHLLRMAPLLAAVLALAALALLTRGLHLDGLGDLADGLGSRKTAQEALEIMRRSDIGPFGVAALVFTLLVQVAALAQAQVRGHGPAALVAAAVTGRLAVAWACRRGVAAARPQGMGALVAGTVHPAVAAAVSAVVLGLAGIVGVVLPSPSGGWLLPAGIAAGLATSLALARHAVTRLGGITGDVLGALTEIGTAVCLTVMAA